MLPSVNTIETQGNRELACWEQKEKSMMGWGARGESTWSSETAKYSSEGYLMENRVVWTLCGTVSPGWFSGWNTYDFYKEYLCVCVLLGYHSKCRNTRFLLLTLLEVQLLSLENRILWFCLLRLHKALYILFERENTKQFFYTTIELNENEWPKYLKYLRTFHVTFRQIYRKAITINIFSADFYTNLYPYSVTFYHNIEVLYTIYILLI